MKGIILAGGSGTRLDPLTRAVSKQLLPIYNKPMIYYPLSILMISGITEILIISTPKDIDRFKDLLGDGSQLGVSFSYKIQEQPNGLLEAFILAEEFSKGGPLTLILGDNIFYGDNFVNRHILPHIKSKKPTIFAYSVTDPERYGVVEFDKNFNAVSIQEKPKNPKSSYAITGLYIFDERASKIAKSLTPSERGELEIVDMIEYYKNEGSLKVEVLGRGVAWLDTGTQESLLEASTFIQVLEKRQGIQIACLEEIALEKKFITPKEFSALADRMGNGSYAQYLKRKALTLKENK
jgi:glucose-1-phosphate thymidylyltransferase